MVLEPPKQPYGPVDKIDAPEWHKQKHSFRMILITVIVLLVAIGGYIVSQNKNLQTIIKNSVNYSKDPSQVSTGSDIKPLELTTIANRTQPWLEVVSENNKTSFGQNEEVVLTVNAYSGGKDITGYDMLLGYDKSKFEVVSATSILEGFTIFPFDQESHYTVTGIKDISNKNATVFDNTPLVRIVLRPKTAGTSVISIIPEDGKEKTQLVDHEVNVLTPQIGGIQVDVQ